jgi:hypothetical protein
MANSHITIDCKMGPAMRATLEAMELVREVMDLIPEWHKSERDALAERVEKLRAVAAQKLDIADNE